MNIIALGQIAFFALAVAAISVTISKSKLFASVRAWISEKNQRLGHLVSCAYCTSHWVAMPLIVIYRPIVVPFLSAVDLIVSWLALVAIAALVSGSINKLTPFSGDVPPPKGLNGPPLNGGGRGSELNH